MTGFKSERRRQKPMMERKRRARINKSLEQLKDVIVDNNGGILARLDKARILELTVDYLQNKTARGQTSAGDERYKAGYMRCANEVTSFLHDKVDDGKLTQIVQYLFTLTANIKNKVDNVNTNKIPSSKLFQTPVSHSTPKGKIPIFPATSSATLNRHQSATSTTTCSAPSISEDGQPVARLESTSIPSSSYLIVKERRQESCQGGFSAAQNKNVNVCLVDSPPKVNSASGVRSKGIDLTTASNREKVNTFGLEPKITKVSPPHQYATLAAHVMDLSNSVHTRSVAKANSPCSRFSREGDFGRARRFGSVCSSTTSGKSSVDADSSSDEEVTAITSRLPVESYGGLARNNWYVADDNDRATSYDMFDSDDDSSTSDVFFMDCENDRCSDKDFVEKERLQVPCLNNEQHVHPREPFPVRQEPAQVTSDVWRPW